MPPPLPTYEGRRPAAMGGMYRSKRGVSQAAGNRSGIDALHFRNAGMSSAEADQAATDIMRQGFNVSSSGEAVPSDLFARSSRMQRAPGPTMRERFGTATATTGASAPVVATGRVGAGRGSDAVLPDFAIEREVMTGTPPPRGLPPTMRDVLSERVDTIGPAGTPTRISSKYGTATLGTPGVRGTVNEGARTRFKPIPLQDYFRQRRAAQRERGIA
jgi:hypothetical protein